MNFRNKYVLAIDQGTTSSRAILFNHQGTIITLAQKPFQQYFPKPGWVEHDPNEIWYTQSSVIKEAMAKADVTDSHIACIGIANQRETTIIWDRETGFPVYNAIVWQDRRTADYCEELKSQGWAERILQKTGLVIDAYFSATKIKWILDNVKGYPGACGAGRAMLRYGRYLAGLETYPGRSIHYGCDERFPYHAFQYPYFAMGPRVIGLVYDTCLDVTASESL